MKLEIDLPYSKRGVCWINEAPAINRTQSLGSLNSIRVAGQEENLELKTLAIELLIPGFAGSMYGLLGVTLEESSGECVIEVRSDDAQNNRYVQTIVQSQSESVFCGLPSEYVNGVKEAMIDELRKSQSSATPMKIVVDLAAHGLVGSNLHIFSKIARSLIQLLVINKIPSKNEIATVLEAQLNAVADERN